MKFKDVVNQISKDQYVIRNLAGDRPFAVTESTPNSWETKMISMDFQNKDARSIEVDVLIMILVEFYGKNYIKELIEKLKSYDDIKDIEFK
ncbi:hypothetical protein D3C81_1057570 [compost metagenome]